MSRSLSPLRYPGGKAVLSDFLAEVVALNGLQDGTYVEPYAGGGGAALGLLLGEHVQRILLNDADPCVYAFWNAVLNRKDELVRRIQKVPLTIVEWRRQRAIYRSQAEHSRISVALATFYLNRCNRSGIMVNGGPIGGLRQQGLWKLDARFNREGLVRRIERIHAYRDRIEMHNVDAITFLTEQSERGCLTDRALAYLDPPYYSRGRLLYLNHYSPADHRALAGFVRQRKAYRWLLSYDNVAEVRDLYKGCPQMPFLLPYSAYSRRTGCELLIHSRNLSIPEGMLAA